MVRNYHVWTILQFFYPPFLIKFLLSWQTHDPWYHSPHSNFCPAATATHLSLLKQSGEAKRMVRNHHVLTILQFFCSHFSSKLLFLWWAWDPWYCSPHTNICPAATATRLSLLKQSGETKVMVTNHHDLTILPFICSPFFNYIAILGGASNPWYRSLQTNFCSAVTAAC